MKKPYIRKYDKVSKFVVWIVNGKYIRKNLDEEFTSFGHHLRFKFIPENEFWIDREKGGNESKFYIDHLLVENRLMSKGMSYSEASEKAYKVQERERSRSRLIKKELKRKEYKEELINKVHKKLLRKYSKKINVWLVSGKLVRGTFFVEFTEGGHDKVYKFIPKNEIWIDNDLSLDEIPFVLLHELHERNLMSRGKGYDKAHRLSSKVEYFCRHHPEQTEKKIKQELKKLK